MKIRIQRISAQAALPEYAHGPDEDAGMDLRGDYAKETLGALVRVWKRPVCVSTKIDNKPVLLRYDGKDHSMVPYKV